MLGVQDCLVSPWLQSPVFEPKVDLVFFQCSSCQYFLRPALRFFCAHLAEQALYPIPVSNALKFPPNSGELVPHLRRFRLPFNCHHMAPMPSAQTVRPDVGRKVRSFLRILSISSTLMHPVFPPSRVDLALQPACVDFLYLTPQKSFAFAKEE